MELLNRTRPGHWRNNARCVFGAGPGLGRHIVHILLRGADRNMEIAVVFGDRFRRVRRGERAICWVKVLVAFMMDTCERTLGTVRRFPRDEWQWMLTWLTVRGTIPSFSRRRESSASSLDHHVRPLHWSTLSTTSFTYLLLSGIFLLSSDWVSRTADCPICTDDH